MSAKSFEYMQQQLGEINENTTCKYVKPCDFKDLSENRESLNFVHLNIRSFHKNIDNLLMLLDDLAKNNVSLDVIMLCETFLNDSTSLMANIPGYQSFHRTRHDRIGGGISMVIRNEIEVISQLDSIFTEEIETMFLSLKYNNYSFVCGEVYRPPNVSPNIFMTNFNTILERYIKNNVIIGTDQNIDLLQIDNYKPARDVLELALLKRTVPCITLPTRVTRDTSTLIDNIYLKTNRFCDMKSSVLINDMSDHYPCLLSIFPSQFETSVKQTIPVRVYNDNSLHNIKNYLLHCDWSCIHSLNTDNAYELLCQYIQYALDLFAPYKANTVKPRCSFSEPWMSVKLLKYNRKCMRLCHRAKQSGLTSDVEKYKNYRRTLNVIKRSEKLTFYTKLFEKIGNDTRTTWSIVNGLSKKYKRNCMISSLIYDSYTVSDPQSIVNCLNKHFASAGEKVQKNIGTVKQNPLAYVKQCMDNLDNIFVSEAGVEKLINMMKPKRSCGYDGISNYLLKEIFVSIRVPFLHVIKKSLKEGKFPEGMKLAKINPLFKSGRHDICDNYRPISLLPVFSKVLEKIVYVSIVKYLTKNDLIYCKQFGFRKKHSTGDAIKLLVSEILNGWNKDMHVVAIFIDLKKAFDTVSHDLILKKISKLGISGNLLNWLKSYLEKRQQFTSMNGFMSDTMQTRVGVPQGSLLGVLLFQLVIDDLRKSVTYSNVILYADDTTLILAGRNLKFLLSKLQSDLNRISVWLKSNHLSLNVKKTKAVLFLCGYHCENLILNVGCECIEFVSNFKFLGFTIDEKLSCSDHVNKLYKELLSIVFMISKLKDVVPIKILKQVYYAHFHSKMNYCLDIWGTLVSKHMFDKIYKLQKRVIRLIAKKPMLSHSDPIFKQLEILKLRDNMELSLCSLIYKVNNMEIPLPIVRIFETGRGSMTTRNNNLIVTQGRKKVLNNSFLTAAIISWNRLSPIIKTAVNIKSMKKLFRTTCISKY